MNRFVLLSVVMIWVVTGCSSTRDDTHRTGLIDRQAAVAPGARHALLREATRQLGVPYRYGGADQRGFDCSGLVQYVHRQVGLTVPRTAAAQRRNAQPIPLRRLKGGDLVFFRIAGGKGNHVGIYEGDGRFIHAPSSGKRVSRADLSNPYWRQHLAGAGTFF